MVDPYLKKRKNFFMLLLVVLNYSESQAWLSLCTLRLAITRYRIRRKFNQRSQQRSRRQSDHTCWWQTFNWSLIDWTWWGRFLHHPHANPGTKTGSHNAFLLQQKSGWQGKYIQTRASTLEDDELESKLADGADLNPPQKHFIPIVLRAVHAGIEKRWDWSKRWRRWKGRVTPT